MQHPGRRAKLPRHQVTLRPVTNSDCDGNPHRRTAYLNQTSSSPTGCKTLPSTAAPRAAIEPKRLRESGACTSCGADRSRRMISASVRWRAKMRKSEKGAEGVGRRGEGP